MQTRSPRKNLPTSCKTFQNKLKFVSIKFNENIVKNKILKQKNEKINGCFEYIQQEMIIFFTALTISTFTCAIAQLLNTFCFLFNLLRLNNFNKLSTKLLKSNYCNNNNCNFKLVVI